MFIYSDCFRNYSLSNSGTIDGSFIFEGEDLANESRFMATGHMFTMLVQIERVTTFREYLICHTASHMNYCIKFKTESSAKKALQNVVQAAKSGSQYIEF